MNKDREEEKLRSFVRRFLEASTPVYWVSWASRCAEQTAKAALENALFRGGELRNLTDENVRAEVLDVVSQSEALMLLVIEDFAEQVEEQAGE